MDEPFQRRATGISSSTAWRIAYLPAFTFMRPPKIYTHERREGEGKGCSAERRVYVRLYGSSCWLVFCKKVEEDERWRRSAASR